VTASQPLPNADARTVAGFGDEWTRFDQSGMSRDEQRAVFDLYFEHMPWSELPQNPVGFDAGCGSGRWADLVAPRVGLLHCVDASGEALAVARRKLAPHPNCRLHEASVSAMPLADGTMDFGYSLGVLHHIPDTAAGIRACAAKLKPGAPLLLYLYYAFDNRPAWFRRVWQVSNVARQVIQQMPYPLRYGTSQVIAASVYYPLARTAKALGTLGLNVSNVPLSAYRDRSFYAMRTDALDRLGTPLEQRFTRDQICEMMEAAGLERIVFGDKEPFWCAVGRKR
jgi:SAM-dependent methyltransferase